MSSETQSTTDMTNPIKYFLIGNSDKNKIITEYTSTNAQPKSKKEINQIFNKLSRAPNKKLDERNKITSKDENYYFLFSKPNLLFIVLANSQYPERFVFELIEKVVEEKIPTMLNDETQELNPNGRQQLKQLIDNYQNKTQTDTISSIQSDVDSLKVDMKNNINKMVESVDDVNNLKDKSDQLKLETVDYQKNSVEVRRITWWQNFKMWIILGGVILLLIIIIIIIVT